MARQKRIKIEITGRQGDGKSVFAREVLLPALRVSGLPFQIIDGGIPVGSSVRTKRGGPFVDVQVEDTMPGVRL